MAPFDSPSIVLSGFRERAEALHVQGDRLYVGTATGNLHVYSIDDSTSEGEAIASLVETKKSLTRRSIEQLGFIKDINSLIVLSEGLPTLFPIPNFAPPTPLAKAKGALSFAVHSSVQDIMPEAGPQSGDGQFAKAIPTMVTQVIIGCRRKVVIYTWRDGETQEVQEAVLPHSPRAIVFLDNDNVCFAYSPTEYAVFSIAKLTTVEVTTPVTASTSMGTFSGLTGYMTLGLGAKAKPGLIRLNDTEALIVKDNQGFIVGAEGKQTRTNTIDWPSPPEEIAFVSPYIFSILPPGTVPVSVAGSTHMSASATQPSTFPSHVVQIRSSISNLPPQTIPFPFGTAISISPPATATAHCTMRLMTSLPSAKSPLYVVTTPTDRTVAATEGTSIWRIGMKPWGDQLDELVQSGLYSDALSLLDSIDSAVLSDKDERRTPIRALHAVSQFSLGKYDDAINTFLELDLNPAKVVALYPESVSGRLSVPRDSWIPLYGGPATQPEDTTSTSSSDTSKEGKDPIREKLVRNALERSPSPVGSVRQRTKTSFAALLPSGPKDDDAASISSRKGRKPNDDFHRSVETLLRYLTDRRPKVAGALAVVHITPAQSHQIAFLSETSTEDLFALPNLPLSSLTPEQLLRFAQIIDTALFKSYLLTRPTLLGPLCRVSNWCEVSEVEEELRAREKHAELIYLYNGKKMHSKALNLLRQLNENEPDIRDRLQPSISYLQKLGPEHLEQIFESSRWVFGQDRDMAFEIFTSEDVELPRSPVADYLERIDPQLCARFLEYLIDEKGEESQVFHDRLVELYLSMTLTAQKRKDKKIRSIIYAKLLEFINTTHHFSIDRLYGLLSSEDLFEARAILLGRMGKHQHALELYVYKLQDYSKAEEYCKRVYQPGTETSNVFLILLRIYLRPTVKTSSNLLQPALDLISRHSPRLDSVETLQLLPPLVTTQDVQTFLLETLRAPIFDTHVVREIHKARAESVARKLMLLETRRVKVTDSRICPQCHKRIGNSVIAVHAPRGEVTHYQCREAFALKLTELRVR
ncbi:hypothetical protein SERLA73DRAFT_168336 [Serpula lacrymans var. lacrymans S7.3]|uniref:CNH domain-containing protein n=2 Tax=Serpula lacrymans var. lacrymans TaxID=341189 RepID=F8PXV6_SERL3|nr:uncharacterized protein SERLADRAFT_449091 [Serpula lacrymans var. lacrymans S7.9]EGN98719.1 hypothetical protein SERLA73DRAFT_168336 [Serpula lacrymans var. lacrymans S7.3]EGO24320.1 hypothetical protein SERLADRAFT_449091 [Serpula lacrymans var. lacrymans S7.9]